MIANHRAIVMLITVAAFGFSSAMATDWTIETVRTAPNGVLNTSVQVAGDTIHVIASESAGVTYGRKVAGLWLIEAPAVPIQPKVCTLAAGDSGRVHIGFNTAIGGSLVYALRDSSGAWSTETADAGVCGSVGGRGADSWALDSTEQPHAVHWDSCEDLVYAWRTAVADSVPFWTVAKVDTAGDVGRSASLALDSNDQPHICYWDATNGALKYAKAVGEDAWAIETIGLAGGFETWTSIELDQNDIPHVAYYDNTLDQDGDLKYASRVSGSWVVENVETVGDVGIYASLALDRSGNPHIAYLDNTNRHNGDLKYACKTGPGWSVEVVEAAVGYTWNALSIDSAGLAHVVYRDSQAIKHAWGCPGVINGAADDDGDGLSNACEECGVDINSDGIVDLNLPALGADSQHKDLFLEIDAMVGLGPSAAAIDSVVEAFSAVPSGALVPVNPDGVDGINLHVYEDLSDYDIPRAPWIDSSAFYAIKSGTDYGFGTDAERSSPNWTNILAAKAGAFRYCVMADSFTTGRTLGMGETPGNDLWILLGRLRAEKPSPMPIEEASLLMHELGHTLGLRHGGDQGDPVTDQYNYKPNYQSVMNALWTFRERIDPTWNSAKQSQYQMWRQGWKLDYSRTAFSTLDETGLDEPAGVGGPSGVWVPAGPYTTMVRLVETAGPVDWDRDGSNTGTGVAADINRMFSISPASPGETLNGHDDWAAIEYLPIASPGWQERPIGGEDTFGCGLTGDVLDELHGFDFDCNGNGIADDVEIIGGMASDSNGNGIPDECESGTSSHSNEAATLSRPRVWSEPNPLSRAARIVFEIPTEGRVSLRVYDVTGREVAVLFDGSAAAGRHDVLWSIDSENGQKVKPGVYLCRLSAAGAVVDAKFVLVH